MKRMLLVVSMLAILVTPTLAREIDGAGVVVDPANIPQGSVELSFYVYNDSQDAEWIGYFGFILPDCMTIVDGTAWSYDPDASWYAEPIFTAYSGQYGAWEGWTSSGYGFMGSTDDGYFYVTVDNQCECGTYQLIHWELVGDDWGDPPHMVEGDLEVFIECETATESTTFGALKALY